MTKKALVNEEAPLLPLKAGFTSITFLTALLWLAKKWNLLFINFGRILGTLLFSDGKGTRLVGWGLHFLNGTLFALGYQVVFRTTRFSPGPMNGAVLGAAHALLGLLALALLPAIHPRSRQAGLRPLRPTAYGPLTIPGMFLGHILYRAVVGWLIHRERFDGPGATGDSPS